MRGRRKAIWCRSWPIRKSWDMDEQRFIGAIALLLVGGNDTTRNSMSGLVEQMNKFPDQWERLKADRSLISTAATETLRLQTPICHMRLTVVQATELGGQKLKAGDKEIGQAPCREREWQSV